MNPSGYWWLGPIACADEIERIAADHRQRARAVEDEAVRPVDAHREIAAANVVDPELRRRRGG